MKTLAFNNGDQLPIIGLGTWKSKPGQVYQAVLWALEAGYRHIDCAAIYNNQSEVGQAFTKAFSDGIVRREELFVTSKLWNSNHRLEDVEVGLKETLRDLRLDYLDLYLIHWPVSFKKGVEFAQNREEYYTYQDVPLEQTWEGMEACFANGLTKHIGVSNFNSSKLNEILKTCKVAPEMNQVEMHPFLPQDTLVKFCKEHGMLMTAYSPLGSGDRSSSIKKADEPSLLQHALIQELASKYACSAAQLLIAYHVARGIAVIPKSINQERIHENLAAGAIVIEANDMETLKNIDTKYRFIDGTFYTGPRSPYSLEDLWEKE
ncbi:aldo/keto reductase [Mongoliitalea daihaiensis]|uniref:aldo/keto reductase n=1 Tax=Mongoliitalea daihaiensis TaxID=2782006 RepID=UPI001F3BA5BD|nr:aldo/keto reductase [Mongoliitalea daihaiensis]UJP64146.1 aldo/keto reductase [Mongoliitalea daihaiensis]